MIAQLSDWFATFQGSGIAFGFAALTAGGLALFAFQIAQNLKQRQYASAVQREMRLLRAAQIETRNMLDASAAKMAGLARDIARKSQAQERKLVQELQMIEAMIRNAATSRQTAAAPNDAESEPHRGDTPDAQRPAEAALAAVVQRALEENRVDLYLQPVVTLPQRKVRFYEAFLRLRSEDGSVIMPAQYVKVAMAAGLMSVVDNLLLFRCVQVVKRLTTKNREIAIFCNISGATLSDANFFPQFLEFLQQHRNLAGQIVFEFPQSAILGASAAAEDRLRRLAALGFRLSMDQVTNLDVDFGRVRRLGFHFIKLRAGTLVSGMAEARAKVAGEDLKALLARDGLNLIAERVEDEKTVLHLLDFNVDFAQGYLFGGPRPVREFSETPETRANPDMDVAKRTADGMRKLAG